MAVHKVEDGGFVISAYRQWIPGVYDTERAAKFALRLRVGQADHLRDKINVGEDRLITWEDIREYRATLRSEGNR